MARCLLFVLSLVSNCSMSLPAFAAEPVVGRAEAVRAPTAAEVQLAQYLYVDFPRCIESLENDRELAAAELDFLRARVDGYRPFRSFGQYSPAYTADRSWQLALLAAEQRQTELQNAEADLWRQRQAVVATYMERAGGR
jgi:hypothetical protein